MLIKQMNQEVCVQVRQEPVAQNLGGQAERKYRR